MRTYLHEIMGLRKGGNLPDSLPHGQFWTVDDPDDPNRLLRPQWDEWGPNKGGWLQDVAIKVRSRGHKYSNAMKPEALKLLTLPAIQHAIETSYETMRARYKLEQDEEQKQERLRLSRHKGRKVNVRAHLFLSHTLAPTSASR